MTSERDLESEIRGIWQEHKRLGHPLDDVMVFFTGLLLERYGDWLGDDDQYNVAREYYETIRRIGEEVYGESHTTENGD
jgi:hypothetical protein